MKAAHTRQADTLGDGRTFRVLNIVDDFSREAIATEMGKSIPGSRVVRALERMARQRGPPSTIVVVHDRMDHVPWYDRCIGNFYDRSSS